MNKVLVEGMVFHAKHGVFEEETVIGGIFEVDIEICTDFSKAMNSDDLDGTIDYSRVYEVVAEEMKTPCKLLEHLGKKIIDRLKAIFHSIEGITIKISKLNPPISGEIDKVSIIIKE